MTTKTTAALLVALLALGACDNDDGTSGWQKATSTTTDGTTQTDSGTDAGSTPTTDSGTTVTDVATGDASDTLDGSTAADGVQADTVTADATVSDAVAADTTATSDASDATQADTAAPVDAAPGHCTGAETCDDSDLCTKDTCVDGQCISTPIPNCAKNFMLVDVNPNDVGGVGNQVALNAYAGFLVLVAFHSADYQAASERAGALQELLTGYIDEGETTFAVLVINVAGQQGAVNGYVLGGGTPVTFPVLQDTIDDDVFGLYGAQNLDMALIDLQGGLPGIISDAWWGNEAIDPGSDVGKAALWEAIDNQLQP